MNDNRGTIKLLLAEDHTILRNGIKALLEKESGISILDEVSMGTDVINKLRSDLKPDVILADVNLLETEETEMIRKLKKLFPGVKILVLSMSDHDQYLLETFRAGADGYVLKNVSRDELVFAIRHVADGEHYICSEIATKLLDKFMHSNDGHTINQKIKTDLSKREMEVLNLIAEGMTNNEIANKLFTSRRTIEGHRKNLIEKTGVRNTAALIRYAIRNGILT